MKASQLASLLSTIPDAEVRIASILVGGSPLLLEVANVAMNNEANAWIIEADEAEWARLPAMPQTSPAVPGVPGNP